MQVAIFKRNAISSAGVVQASTAHLTTLFDNQDLGSAM